MIDIKPVEVMNGNMNKRDDIQIYILAHKEVPYGIWDNSLYTPLQVGAFYNPHFTELTDDTGKNIGDLNPIFAEITGTYWLRYNAPETLKYIGQVQYRRRLQFDENTDFDTIFADCDAICAVPIFLGMSVYEQFCKCHNRKVMENVEQVIKEKYPEMAESFDKYIKHSPIIFYSNSFILKKPDFDTYADFCHNVIIDTFSKLGLDSIKKVQDFIQGEIDAGRTPNNDGFKGYKTPLVYQQQIGGFLSERLWTLWAQHTFGEDRIKLVPYKKYEGV